MEKNEKDKEYLEIDPIQLLKALWKRLWIILLAMIVCGGSMFWYTKFIVPERFTAKAMLYVNNSSISVGNTSLSISSTEITAAKSLVNTYMIILKSRTVLNEVITQTGVPYSYTDIKGMIDAESVNQTEIFEVRVTCYDPNESEQIANAICRILPEKIEDIMQGSSVRVVDYAVVPSVKSAPNVTNKTALGLVIGFLLSAAAILIFEMMDQYIRSEDYLLQTFSDIPILAIIPDLDEHPSKKKSTYYYSSNRREG
ncbi:MAG: hypothetical protein E7553_02820 [Ruminococcaceae bacterium]|nr:hypothetical protein [Oscillospiraceae bacterium]